MKPVRIMTGVYAIGDRYLAVMQPTTGSERAIYGATVWFVVLRSEYEDPGRIPGEIVARRTLADAVKWVREQRAVSP